MGKHIKERIFRMKKFNVNHSRSANKVGVDGVLIGAWANAGEVKRVLDAGCGCGLISLMIAQRAPQAIVTGIDIDTDAVEEAKENVANSPWKERIEIMNVDFTCTQGEYDLIISNPPFFDDGVRNVEESSRMLARHIGSLSPESLIKSAHRLLSKTGRLSLIARAESFDFLIESAKDNGLIPERAAFVKGHPEAPAKRVMIEFQKDSMEGRDNPESLMTPEYIEIESAPGVYSSEYIALCKDFYIIFPD